jgi:hypothetical protein
MQTLYLSRRKLSFSLSLALALVVVGLVYADNVLIEVVSGGNDTLTLGGSTTINYRIQQIPNDPQGAPLCYASDGSSAKVTINTPSGVSASPNPLTFNTCGINLPTTFTASAAGNYPITASVIDAGAGTYNTSPANFTLKVLPSADSTPPVITANVTGTLAITAGMSAMYTSAGQ